MLRLRLAEELEEQGWNRYQLAKEAGGIRSKQAIYLLGDRRRRPKQINLQTFDLVCCLVGKSPNDLLVRERDESAGSWDADDLCDRHAARGWSEGSWLSFPDECPMCQQELCRVGERVARRR